MEQTNLFRKCRHHNTMSKAAGLSPEAVATIAFGLAATIVPLIHLYAYLRRGSGRRILQSEGKIYHLPAYAEQEHHRYLADRLGLGLTHI